MHGAYFRFKQKLTNINEYNMKSSAKSIGILQEVSLDVQPGYCNSDNKYAV